MRKDKILITGATGLLGSSLAPYLRQLGCDVVTHGNTSHADLMFDLANSSKSYEVLEKTQPDIIINLVSLTSVELCEENINLADLMNTYTVENITNWMHLSQSNCHLIQISTDHVYDGNGVHKESDVKITNNYAFSKYGGELAAAKVPSTILRTNFVGRSKVSYRESLTDWVYNSIQQKKNVQVLNDVYFSPLSIGVLIEMINITVIQKRIGVYNLGSRIGMSKGDFDFTFAEFLKLPTNTMARININEATFLKAYRPKNMCMDSSKFEEEFNVKLPSLIDLIPLIAEEYSDIA